MWESLGRSYIYLPDGGKAHCLPVFEIRASHGDRTISTFSFLYLGRACALTGAAATSSRRRSREGWEVGGAVGGG
jgi:hypothetical protein